MIIYVRFFHLLLPTFMDQKLSSEIKTETTGVVPKRNFLKMSAGVAITAILDGMHESLLSAGEEEKKKARSFPPLPETWEIQNNPQGQVNLRQKTVSLEGGGSIRTKKAISNTTYYLSFRWKPAKDSFEVVLRTSGEDKGVALGFSVEDKQVLVSQKTASGEVRTNGLGEMQGDEIQINIVDGNQETLHLIMDDNRLRVNVPEGTTGRKIVFRNTKGTSQLHSIVIVSD